MPPRGSWGGSTPQAKPKPRPHSAASSGPKGGPARGDGPRCPDTGGGGPSHLPHRPSVDAQSGPRGSDAQPAPLHADDPGMFAVPLYSAMRRDAPAGGGQCPPLDAAARDPPLPGPAAAAAPAAAAPPAAAAFDHGNQPGSNGGAKAVKFGEFATNGDDDAWGDWGGDGFSGPVLHGARPTGVGDGFGSVAGGTTGWGGGGSAGTAYGRLDGSGPCPSGGHGTWDAWGGFPPPSAAGPPAEKVQRWNAAAQRRSASADVREVDARRASGGPVRGGPAVPPSGAPAQGAWAGFSTVLDPFVASTAPPRRPPTGLRRGRFPPGSLMRVSLGFLIPRCPTLACPPRRTSGG